MGNNGDVVGAGLFAETYPFLKKTVLTWGDYGKITLPQVLGVNHWLVIATIISLTLVLFYWLEKYENSIRRSQVVGTKFRDTPPKL